MYKKGSSLIGPSPLLQKCSGKGKSETAASKIPGIYVAKVSTLKFKKIGIPLTFFFPKEIFLANLYGEPLTSHKSFYLETWVDISLDRLAKCYSSYSPWFVFEIGSFIAINSLTLAKRKLHHLSEFPIFS